MKTSPFTFTGSGDEYFKIWIVNLLLNIVTLGIYSAWATVRRKRYFYGNTWLDDANFEYHGKPLQILVGRVIAIGLLVAYTLLSNTFPIIGFGLLLLIMAFMPWLVWRSMQFNARMSSYRNVRFSFHGSLGDAYKYLLLIPLLPMLAAALLIGVLYAVGMRESSLFIGVGVLGLVSTYLLFPWVEALITRYHLNYSQYGQGKFSADIHAGAFYKIYLKWLGVMLGGWIVLSAVFGIIILVIAASSGTLDFESLRSGKLDAENTSALILLIVPIIFLVYIAMILFGIFVGAYLKTRIHNYVFNHTRLDNVLALGSTIGVWGLTKIYATNFLLMMLTMGIATPWIEVRLHKFMLANTLAHIDGDLGQYVTAQQDLQSALGDEMGDAFDLQTGFEVGL